MRRTKFTTGKGITLRMGVFAFLAVIVTTTASLPKANADLRGFESGSGYYIASPGWVDVSYYNAGQYGPFAGNGPGPTAIAPNSGLWKIQSEVGGFFATSALRNAATSGAPPYPNPNSIVGIPAYIIGNHAPGRSGFGALAVRNDTGPGTGWMQYDYTLDQYDFNGVAPASITSGTMKTQFYFCPNPTNTIPRTDKFIMSFKDSANNTGLELGYAMDNEVYWRQGNSGLWNYTGVYANSTNWDGFRVNINLSADTFGIDYYSVSSNLWSTMVASGTALGNPMQDLTHLGWGLSDGVNNGLGGKNFFDDFSFSGGSVPEPSTASLLGLAGLAGLVIRRKHRRTM